LEIFFFFFFCAQKQQTPLCRKNSDVAVAAAANCMESVCRRGFY
jgi:hypothetical protein